VQPDSWGQRTRARLIAEIFASLKGIPADQASVEEIAHVSNVVVPCFLLELGRRRRHIEIEFLVILRFRCTIWPPCGAILLPTIHQQ